MGDVPALPSVEETQSKIAGLVREKMAGFIGSAISDFTDAARNIEAKRLTMVERHRTDRQALLAAQDVRWIKEAVERAERFRRGVLGLWDRLTGKQAKLHGQNERETAAAAERDARDKQILIERQLDERRRLQREIDHARLLHTREMALLYRQDTGPGWCRTIRHCTLGSSEPEGRACNYLPARCQPVALASSSEQNHLSPCCGEIFVAR
jgi:hypothetical protein